MSNIIPYATVDALCAHRTKALELYKAGIETLQEAIKEHQAACYMGGGINTPYLNSLDEITKNIDRNMWASIIKGTPIGSLMDKQEKEAFEKSLKDNPPPATVENIAATLQRLVAESDMIFRRGLVTAFEGLNRGFKSNDGFKLGERIVILHGVTYDKWGYFRFGYRADDDFHDVDRVMHVLDGRPSPSYEHGLYATMRQAFQDFNKTGKMECSTEYWRVRFFKKGTVHLYPLRKDLLDRANKLIAEHFGEVIPAGHGVHNTQPDYRGRADQSFNEDFFETPAEAAQRVIDLADVQIGHKVLEPSAGEGGIAKLVPSGAFLDCVEINSSRAELLKKAGFKVENDDFLNVTPAPLYDSVIMNPPFSDRQDVRHVLHALKFLKPEGVLVAVMSASVQSRSDKLTEHLREVMEQRGGWFERLPEKSFKTSGTLVNTVIAYIPGVR